MGLRAWFKRKKKVEPVPAPEPVRTRGRQGVPTQVRTKRNKNGSGGGHTVYVPVEGTVSARVIRANGDVEDLGVIAEVKK